MAMRYVERGRVELVTCDGHSNKESIREAP